MTPKNPASAASPKRARAIVTLGDLAVAYLDHLDKAGRSNATLFGYGLELRLACAVLGTETPVADLTAEQVEAYNACERVTTTRDGRPKSKAGEAKTRRVLRLALAWAEAKRSVPSASA
jgi:hypothetical protein